MKEEEEEIKEDFLSRSIKWERGSTTVRKRREIKYWSPPPRNYRSKTPKAKKESFFILSSPIAARKEERDKEKDFRVGKKK